MKRIFSMLCVLALMLGMLAVPAYATDAEGVLANENIVLSENAENLTVEEDTYIDLNGYSIAGVTVKDGATLYVSDSQTDDYTVADGIYGKITDAEGNVQADEGYVAINEDGLSYHKVDLTLTSMTLRPAAAGVYYNSAFAADEVVAANVECYGVALSVVAEPTAENLDTLCGYSTIYGFEAGEKSGTLLSGIMNDGNTDFANDRNAAMNIYGRAYIKTAEGYTFGTTASRNLKEQVEAIDAIFSQLNEAQSTAILSMYSQFRPVMENWNVPNMKHAAPVGDTVITVPVETEDGEVTETVTVEQDGVTITIPFGTLVESNELTLTVTRLDASESEIEAGEGQTLMPFDVHVDGIAAENTQPLTVALGKVMPENLNMGNYTVYHVEEDGTKEMELVASAEDLTDHNQYAYTLDGELTLNMATFSEIAALTEDENGWNGNVDHSWYNADAETLYIRTADQLWSLSQIVGGMEGCNQDSFDGKTIVLLADIDLADSEAENDLTKIFYPIGYYNSEGTYEKSNAAITSSFKSFKGTFDGNGNKISNIYQNTWEMKGDHNWYDATLQYYRDGMGLFGKVYGGTVKNLTVENFKSDGEIATTGVIAAYADCGATFENIAITNCNPRVYNIGNGGIVGCAGWYAKTAVEKPITFKNITVDQTNKISALWGTYDVSCGGILGQYYPVSGQGDGYQNGGIHFENCHVAAVMDVYNDVCANYQYYWYRYSGMFIGTVRANVKEGNYTVADTTGITADNCTYTYGEWNQYWYCELVKNSLASYTHDHQFSRLTTIDALSDIATVDAEGKVTEWLQEGNFVIPNEDNTAATCYHIFKNSEGKLYQHFHDQPDETNPEVYETINGVEMLKEDRQCYFMPFNQVMNGLGYGVKAHYDFEEHETIDIKEATTSVVKAEEKFDSLGTVTTYRPGQTITLGQLVSSKVDETKLSKASIYASVSPVTENGIASATYSLDLSNWTNSTLTFATDCADSVKIVITDYFYCKPLTITLDLEQAAEKFDANANVVKNAYTQITLGELFAAKNGATIGNVTATVTDPNGKATTVTGTSADWAAQTIDLVKDGTWTVVIKDDDAYCAVTETKFTVSPVDKFIANENVTVIAGEAVELGELFEAADGVIIDSANVMVTGGGVSYIPNAENWELATVTVTDESVTNCTIQITDNVACNTAQNTVAVELYDYFTTENTLPNTAKYIYRVGNKNEIKLGSLFAAKEGNIYSDVTVKAMDIINDNAIVIEEQSFAKNSWSTGAISFATDYTGLVEVHIDALGAKECTVVLEVIDAKNATTATSTAGNNVVLLNDIAGTFTVSGGNTFYGNGFTVTLPTAHETSYTAGFTGYIHVDNGNLDNVKIVGPVYPEAYIYRSQAGNETDGCTYFKNSVLINAGDCSITNSYISGSRAAIYVKNGGDVVIENTTVSGGAYANIEVSVANSVTFKNLTTEQKTVKDDYNAEGSKKDIIGLGIVVNSADAEIYIDGTLDQYNWITEAQWDAMLGSYANQFPDLFGDNTYKDYWHYRENDTTTKYINLTLIFACDWDENKWHDKREDKGYYAEPKEVTIVSTTGAVYSVVNAGTLTDALFYAPAYEASAQYPVAPAYEFDYDAEENYVAVGGTEEDANAYCYEDSGVVKISFSEGNQKIWYTSILSVKKGTEEIPYTVSMNGTDYTGGTITFDEAGDYVVKYAYTDPYNYKLDESGNIVSYGKDYEKTVNITVSVVEDTAKNATFTMGTSSQAVDKILIGNNTYLSASGLDNSSWTSGTGLKFPQSDGDTSTISFKYNGKTNGSWASATINGQTFYFPVVAMGTSDGKFAHGLLDGNWYGCFPVFDGAITITDYADGGTGAEVIYNSSTTTMPANLAALYPQTVFRYQGTQSKVPTTPSKMTKGTYNGKLCYTTQTDLSSTNTRSEEWNLATYTYTDNKGTTYYWYVAYYCEAATQSSSAQCVTGDTLITLADGTQKRIDELLETDVVRVFDHETGSYAEKPIFFYENSGVDQYNVINLQFADGNTTRLIYEHALFDLTLNQYVYIREDNCMEFVGHMFAKDNGNGGFESVKLENAFVAEETVGCYSITTEYHLNYYINDMLSLPGGIEGLFNYFEYDPTTLRYDQEQMEADIEKYGLYTYEDFADYATEEMFAVFVPAKYFKVAVGKGMVTYEEILEMISMYF